MLAQRECRDASDQRVSAEQLSQYLRELEGWRQQGEAITREWKFPDHYQAVAFVNAIAWISHKQDHHPDIELGYNRVQVRYSTHSSGGVTEKDLICAAKVLALHG